MTKPKSRPVIQVATTKENLRRLKCIAAYRGQTITGVIHGWIGKVYHRLPEAAKSLSESSE